MDGFELTKALRLDPRLAGAAFIALTGFQASEYAEQAFAAGMQKVLTKPVGTEKLMELLQGMAR